MATTTVDLPVTTARIVYDDGTPDAFVSTLADESTSGEIVLVVTGGATHIYPVNWDGGPDVTVVLPDPPAGYTLTDAHYVVLGYREADTGGGDSSDFGMNPNPDNAPYLFASTSDQFTIDYLPIGGYDGIVVGRGSENLSLLATGAEGDYNGDAWTVGNIVSTTDGIIHVAYMALRLVYTSSELLPCDTSVELDLSTAVFLDNNGTLSGQYLDGVICTTTDFLQPDFYIPGLTVDPSSVYRITFTYDPDSVHDGGQREAYVSGLRPGSEQGDVDTAYGAGDEYSDIAVWWDTGFATTGDVLTFTVGPGRGPGPVADDVAGIVSWDDATYGPAAGYTAPWFESSAGAALSGITIRKLCTFGQPWQRLTNRNFGLTRANYYTQGSTRLTGAL